MRGSFSSRSASDNTWRSDSSTRRMRSLIDRHHLALGPDELPVLAGEVPLGPVQQLPELSMAARHAGHRQAGALPELVVVDLGDRGAKPVLELGLGRVDVLPLPLQRARFGEVQLDGEDADVAGCHQPYVVRSGRETGRIP